MTKIAWWTTAAAVVLATVSGAGRFDDNISAALDTPRPGAAASTSAADGEPIRVTALFDLSGPAAAVGERLQNGMDVAATLINDRGGVDGRPLEIDYHDSESSPERAVEIARQLIRDGVNVIIGPAPTAQCEAVRQITEPAGVVMWCISPVPEPSDTVFLALEPADISLGGIPGLFFAEQGWERVACLSTSDASGEAHLASVQAWADRLGFEVVASETFTATDTDVTVQLTKIRNADPDVIYSCASAAGAHATVLKGMDQLGMEQPVFISLNSVSRTLADIVAPSLPDGGVYSEGSTVILGEELPTDMTERDHAIDFIGAYEAAYPGDTPDTPGGYMFDVLGILAEALADDPDADGAAVARAIEQVCDYQGVLAEYCFSADDHRGYQQDRPLIINWTADATFELEVMLDRSVLES